MRALPILTYHSISTVSTGELAPYTLTPGQFAGHMTMLRDASYAVWSVERIGEALCQGRRLPDRVVGLSFDDAFADFATAVVPVLERFGFGATLYIPTAYLGARSEWLTRFAEDRRPVLDCETIASLPGRGIDCGSHSHTHPELDRVAPAALRAEVARSRAILEQVTGRRVRSFAYPYGYYNRRVRAAVMSAGYRYACGTGHEAAWPGADLFALPRLLVYAGTDVSELQTLLARPASAGRHKIERAKQTAWRVSRRISRSDGGRGGASASAVAPWPAPRVESSCARRPGAGGAMAGDAPSPCGPARRTTLR
jgi:peptidoglycan/xylan/chitin deacetylase (PgdA/CDA1 family)